MTRRDAVVLVYIPLSDNLIPDKDGPPNDASQFAMTSREPTRRSSLRRARFPT